MIRAIFGSIIGAVIALGWMYVSWVFLSWHDTGVEKLKNPSFVSWALSQGCERDGVYMIPQLEGNRELETPKQASEALIERDKKMKEGPLIRFQVALKGVDPSNIRIFIYSFFNCICNNSGNINT